MTFPEKIKDKLYYNNLPNKIKKLFPNIQYNPCDKTIFIQKNDECKITISGIEKLYYKDDIFYIISDLYMLIIWDGIKQWDLIKRV